MVHNNITAPPETVPFPSRQRAALVIAHPGHELHVLGWVGRTKPTVFLLTDGSGTTGRSRLSSSARLLRESGAKTGFIYGPFRDVDFYDSLIMQRHNVFVGLAQELAECLGDGAFDTVAGDAAEGREPAHDVCRVLVDTAVEIVRLRSGRSIENLEFSLHGRPSRDERAPTDEYRVRISLSQPELDRKLAAAKSFPEIAADIESALETWGVDAFRIEELRARLSGDHRLQPPTALALYERQGEQRVAQGLYRKVLRYDDHVAPLVNALHHLIDQESSRATPAPGRRASRA